MEKAFKQFFRKCKLKKQGKWKGKTGYPKLKSKKKGIGSFRLTGHIHVEEKYIQLPRLGKLRLKERGYIPTSGVKILSAIVSERAGRWYVSVQVEEEQDEPRLALGPTLGIDLGIKRLATLSDARVVDNPRALKSNLKKLKRLSRSHSRKVKRSNNRRKSARKLARLHAHIANVRSDTLQKASSMIISKAKSDHERPACIVLEDLHIRGMLKNRKLARSIADVGFYEFRRQLEYKAKLAGSLIYTVSRWEPSSKTCSWCGWVDENLTLADRTFCCRECGYTIDRDLNAALNLALFAAG